MKKSKWMNFASTVLGTIAVVLFILSVWKYQTSVTGLVLIPIGCGLSIAACVLLFFSSLPFDKEKLFRNMLIPFLLHAFAVALQRIFLSGTIGDLFHSIAVLALGAFLVSGILAMFRKNMLSIAMLVGIVVGVLTYFELDSIASLVFLAGDAALLIISIVLFKKNKDQAFWNIVFSLIVIAFYIVEKVRPDLAAYHYVMHLGLISTIGCAVTAIPLPEEEETQEKKEVNEDISERTIPETVTEEPLPLEMWVVKKYRDLSLKELENAPISALKGVSEEDAELLEEAFGIKTIKEFATNKYFKIADEIFEDALK